MDSDPLDIIRVKDEVVGLIPAAGKATRIQPLPCSKEILPVGFYSLGPGKGIRLRPVCTYLIESLYLAGIEKAFVLLRKGKWDIAEYLGNGRSYGLKIAYISIDNSISVPYTLGQAYPFVKNKIVLLGFPDVLFKPSNAFKMLLQHHMKSTADISLGLFPAADPSEMDMVETSKSGQVLSIYPKPKKTTLKLSWIIAAWKPSFFEFLMEIKDSNRRNIDNKIGLSEVFIGDIIQSAIENGFRVDSLKIPHGKFIDIGTSFGLKTAMLKF